MNLCEIVPQTKQVFFLKSLNDFLHAWATRLLMVSDA